MKKEKDILDGYFKSAKQEKVDISLADVNLILEKVIHTGVGSQTVSTVTKAFFKLKYFLISSATLMSVVLWLFSLSSNTKNIDKQEIQNPIIKQLKTPKGDKLVIEKKVLSVDVKPIRKLVKHEGVTSLAEENSIKESSCELRNLNENLSSEESLPESKQVISSVLLKEKEENVLQLPDEHIDLPPEHDDVLLLTMSEKKEESEKTKFKAWDTYGYRHGKFSQVRQTNIFTFFGLGKPKVYLLNSENKTIYNDISNLIYNHKKWAKVYRKEKYGFVDKKGVEVVKPRYSKIFLFDGFHKDWAKVEKKGNFGFIDTTGKEVVNTQYQNISLYDQYKENWALVEKDNKLGFIDYEGQEIVKPKYDKIFYFGEYRENWAKVKLEHLYGFINDKGKEVLPPQYERIFYFNNYKETWAMVKKNKKYGFIDDKAREVVKPIYDKISYFDEYKEDWALIYVNKKYGFINDKGKEIVAPIYDRIYQFGVYKEDWALVIKAGKYGFINDKGQEIVSAKYDKVGYFGVYREGWMKVIKDGMESFINEKGVPVIEFNKRFYESSMQYEFKDEKLIIKDKDGNIINGEGESIELLEQK